MRNQAPQAQRRRRAAAGACAATVFLACTPPSLAQDTPASLLDGTAATVVRDAASHGYRFSSARGLTSFALDLIGIRYKWGGANLATGLDCSGLVHRVPADHRRHASTLDQGWSRIGEQVTLSDLKPGDLVFFNTRHFAFSHVGIYIGDNSFIHAPRRGREVEVATIDRSYWQKHFNGARRLIGVLPEMVPALITEAFAAESAAATPHESPAELAAFPDTQP